MRKLLHKMLSAPAISIVLRRVVENNFKKQKEIIKKYFVASAQDKVLDIGCGTGEFSEFFTKENYTGIDIDPKNIDYAAAHYQGTFLVADATRLPFADHSFSKVLVIGVFHHLSDGDATKVLAEIKRVLRPDGTFLVMEDTRSKNPLTMLLHYFDQGDFIRTKAEWETMFSQSWAVREHFTFKNRICYYSAFLLNQKSVPEADPKAS